MNGDSEHDDRQETHTATGQPLTVEARLDDHDIRLDRLERLAGLDTDRWATLQEAIEQSGMSKSTLYRRGLVVRGRVFRSAIPHPNET